MVISIRDIKRPHFVVMLLLVVSVCINVFFAGFLGAQFLRKSRVNNLCDTKRAIVQMAHGLPTADGRILADRFDQMRSIIAAKCLATVKAREKIHIVIGAVPFNKDALNSAATQYIREQYELNDLVAKVIVKSAEDMSPAGRRALSRYKH